jgi:MoxR-like ATPase
VSAPVATRALIDAAVAEIARVLIGKDQQLRQALCCLLAGGHLLIEDLPGMGKTTLSMPWRRCWACPTSACSSPRTCCRRISSACRSTIARTTVSGSIPGPIFTQVLLADEINRSTPRTQSALLEAMAERQVSLEGETRELPDPFFVIATQNPLEQSGTYPLPESQLDRFLMRIELGYPDPAAERALLRDATATSHRIELAQRIDAQQLAEIRAGVDRVHAAESLLDYVQRLAQRSREPGEFAIGLSPRGVLALLRSAKTWALMNDRDHVLPDDVQAVLPAVTAHRLQPGSSFAGDGAALVALLQREVDVV